MKTDTEYLERAVIAMYVREREQNRGIAGSMIYIAEETGLPVTRVRAILGWFDNVPRGTPDSSFSVLE